MSIRWQLTSKRDSEQGVPYVANSALVSTQIDEKQGPHLFDSYEAHNAFLREARCFCHSLL